jgi:hypothetical protein
MLAERMARMNAGKKDLLDIEALRKLDPHR